MKLSVVIAAKNEEKNIARCLKSVQWADELVVVDDKSSDNTVQIARSLAARVFVQNSKGEFHRNKNLAIEKASGDWILSLDADEVIPPELAREIRAALKDEKMLGYFLVRKNFFLGKWIRGCGWYPDCIIRLFQKGVTQWPLNIHETPRITPPEKVGLLKTPFLHYSYISFTQYVEKFNLYTSCLAREEWAQGVRVEKLASFLLFFFLKPFLKFLQKYILLRGYRDGFRGLFISIASAWTIFISHAKLWEMQRKV